MKVLLYNVKTSDIKLGYTSMYKNHLVRFSGHSITKREENECVILEWKMHYTTRCASILKICNEIELLMDNLKVQDDKVTRIDNYIDIDPQEKGVLLSLMKPEYNLYDYQTRDIIWMRQKEQSILSTPINELVFQGGLYANQVGLGKTLTLLMLIQRDLLNERESERDNYETDDTVCNYKASRGKKKGEFCRKALNAGTLYCKEHNKRTFHGSRIIQRKQDAIESTTPQTGATLVFCPTHITSQWLDEVVKFFGISMRAILYINKSSIDIMTKEEIFGADLIILPHSLMTCLSSKLEELNARPVFKRLIYDECHELNLKHSEYYKDIKLDARVIWCVSGTPFPRQEKNFLMYMTLLTQHKKSNFYNRIYYRTSWLDTMYHNPCVQETVAMVMRRNGDLKEELDFSIFRENCRRNTKEQVQHELQTFRLIDTVKLLEFTRIERNIYESYKRSIHHMIRKELLQLCCDTELIDFTNDEIKKCETLEQVSELLLTNNRVKLEHLGREMLKAEMELEYLTNGAQEVKAVIMTTYRIDDAAAQEWYIKQLIQQKQKRTELTNRYKCQYSMVSYLGDSINRLKKGKQKVQDEEEDVECAICLGEYDTDITVLECGHIYCTECFDMITKSVKSCPTCKGQIKNKARYDRSKKEETVLDEYTGELGKLVEKLKSTKMANIVDYIRKQDTKCIVFSQWETLLHKIGDNLMGCGIKVEYCEGSIYKRTKSIKNFTTSDDANVILLSSKNAASGLNLTVADTIILLEPVYGDVNYKENIENQAIGRVNRIGQKRDVKIIRFLIKDTIEEEIHNGTVDFKDIQKITDR